MSAATRVGENRPLYVEVAGTTCYVNGERGQVMYVRRGLGLDGRAEAAVVALDERRAVLYVGLGASAGGRGQYSEVESVHEVTRDEFDQLMEIDVLRRELGWRDEDDQRWDFLREAETA